MSSLSSSIDTEELAPSLQYLSRQRPNKGSSLLDDLEGIMHSTRRLPVYLYVTLLYDLRDVVYFLIAY
jgi:hypothetical protein